jgi:polyhydroxyalkanoate synthase
MAMTSAPASTPEVRISVAGSPCRTAVALMRVVELAPPRQDSCSAHLGEPEVMAVGLLDPVVGRTPRVPIGRAGGATVYRYDGHALHATPVLLVPNLGIAAPFILDLLPGRSLIEYLVSRGFDVYLLDWCVGPEGGRDPTFDDAVGRILPRACRMVADHANTNGLALVAYCMGAAMALASFASAPPCHLHSLVTMAGPVDFARAGLFTRWVDRRYFDVDRIVDVFGCAPAILFQVGGAMLRPTLGASFLLDLLAHLHDPQRVDELMAVAKWVREFVPVPGEFFRIWIRLFYQDNRLYRGTLRVGDRLVQLQTIRCPVLVLAAHEDPIAPPASARALLEVIGSRDQTYVEVAGSHLALLLGPEATGRAWPALAAWLTTRDGPSAA